jgi:hypothetical protein
MNISALTLFIYLLVATCCDCSAQWQLIRRLSHLGKPEVVVRTPNASVQYSVKSLNDKILSLMRKERVNPSSFDKIENNKPLDAVQEKWVNKVNGVLNAETVNAPDDFRQTIMRSLAKGTEYDVDSRMAALYDKHELERSTRELNKLSLKSVNKVTVYLSIASNSAEYKNIFKSLNKRDAKTTIATYNHLRLQNNKLINFPKSASTIIKGIAESTNRLPIIIIGHNERGNLIFPDGSSASFRKMDSLAKESERLLVYLSCNAQEYTTFSSAASHFLTYRDAVELTNRLNQVDYTRELSQKQVRAKISEVLNLYAKEREMTIGLRVAGMAIGVAGVSYGIYIIEKKVSPTQN